MHHLSIPQARQLSVFAQRLGEARPPASKERMLDILQSIRCLQLDPIRAVERTQFTVLWSRMGSYDRAWLNELTHQDKQLFEYWAHAASIVLTKDYSIHQHMMNKYGTDPNRKITKWIVQNQNFKNYVLAELDKKGELLTQDFEDIADVPWGSSGWTNNRSLPYMLDYLWTKGEIMVSNRDGLKRWWDLSRRVLPTDVDSNTLSEKDVTRRAADLALRALGIGTVRDINNHFTRKRYPHLKKIVPKLVEEGLFVEATIDGLDKGPWYIHKTYLSFLKDPTVAGWRPRTTLLSPFDNLICDRDRTELLWDFYYRIEIYVPQAKRQYGYYVLPILHGADLIGRIDSRMDRKAGVYTVDAVFAEPYAPMAENVGADVHQAICELGRFLGAKKVKYGRKKPAGWRPALQTQSLK